MAIKSFRDRNPYLIGMASVGVIAVMTAIAFFVGYSHILQKTYTMSGVFSDSGGIHGEDNVLVAGVKAGRVTSVKAVHVAADCHRAQLDPNVLTSQGPNNGCVIVTFKVNRGIHLGPDTHAQIILQTLLGTRALRLTGPVVTPFMDKMPAAARQIPIDRTEVPFDIADLVNLGTHSIESTHTDKLNQLIRELATVSQGKQQQIGTLLSSVAQISDTLSARDAQVRDLIDRADRLSGQLADKDKTLVALIDQSRGILTEVQRRRNDIAAGLESGNAAVSELDRIIRVNKATIDAALTSLHPVLNAISARQANIDQALAALGPGLYTQGLAASHGPWADVYIKAIGPDLAGCISVLSGQAAPTAGTPASCAGQGTPLKGIFGPGGSASPSAASPGAASPPAASPVAAVPQAVHP